MEPSYNPDTGEVTIPKQPGVTYRVNGKPVSGRVSISEPTTVEATLRGAARFREGAQTEWHFAPDPVDRSSTKDDLPGLDTQAESDVITD